MRLPRKLFKKLRDRFNNEEMLQLFEKFSEGELTGDEKKKIDKWVHAYEDRPFIFEKLNKTMEFQKKLSVAKESDARDILKELKETFPEDFAGIPDDFAPFMLLRVLRTSVGQLNWDMCWALANGNRWIRVLAFSVRTAIVILIILISYEIFFHKS